MPKEPTDEDLKTITDALKAGSGPASEGSLTKQQYQIFVAHIQKFHKSLTCPFCGTVDQWSVEPIGVVPDYGPGTLEDQMYAPRSGRLYIALGCRKCFFVYHFAWLPIMREAEPTRGTDGASKDDA